MSSSPRSRDLRSAAAVRVGAGLLALATCLVATDDALSGQAANPVVAATLEPDSIRVGAIFALDLWVDLPAAGEVRFPAVLPLPEDVEQREAVQVESNDGGRSWRARYALSAWSADSLTIPPVEVSVAPEAGEEFPVTIVAPTVVVTSVLTTGEDLALRDARPFLRVRSFPWWVLALLVVAGAAAYGWWRRRGGPGLTFAPAGPANLALRDLDRLRGEWTSGDLSVGQFYDRYERTLRRYVRTTRRWAPNRSLIGLGAGGDLLSALRRSTFVRFAHLRASRSDPVSAVDAGEHFIRSEMPAEDAPPGPAS